MWVAVPGLWREKPEAGRRRIKNKKSLGGEGGALGLEYQAPPGWSWRRGRRESDVFPSDIRSHSQKALVPAKFKSLRIVKGCHIPQGRLPGK